MSEYDYAIEVLKNKVNDHKFSISREGFISEDMIKSLRLAIERLESAIKKLKGGMK